MTSPATLACLLSAVLVSACATAAEQPPPAPHHSNFAVYSLDPAVDLSGLSDGIAKHPYQPPATRRRYLPAAVRDHILRQEKMERVLAWEEDEIDIFYKSLVNTPLQYLPKKYDFLSRAKYERLKELFANAADE